MNCKKIVYRSDEFSNPTIVYGVVVSDDGNHIVIRTGRRVHEVLKSCLLSKQDTDIPFVDNT